MKRAGTALIAGTLTLMATGVVAQQPTGAERGLLGINLFDPSVRVITVYGTPDEIQAVNIGGGVQPGGGGGNPFGGSGGPSFGGPPGRGGGGGMGGPAMQPPSADFKNPFSFGDDILKLQGQSGKGDDEAGGGFPGGPASRPGGLPPGVGPGGMGPSGVPFPGGGPGGGGAPGRGFGGAADAATFTRWVYNRSGSRYGFIIDKFGRVVQIEAIGLQNAKVRTRKGVGFGDTFAKVIKSYRTPDGYEIAGDNITVKFLTRSKVAFRLSRLGPNKPQVVTGVVVAAGKG